MTCIGMTQKVGTFRQLYTPIVCVVDNNTVYGVHIIKRVRRIRKVNDYYVVQLGFVDKCLYRT